MTSSGALQSKELLSKLKSSRVMEKCLQILCSLLAKQQVCKGFVRVGCCKGAAAVSTAGFATLALGADTILLQQASITALLQGCSCRVELCGNCNEHQHLTKSKFLLNGSATINRKFNASLWQPLFFFKRILLRDLVIPHPPGNWKTLLQINSGRIRQSVSGKFCRSSKLVSRTNL